jgi:hypothetical protein
MLTTTPLLSIFLSVSKYGRDIEAQAGWWDLGASIHSTWDSTYQGFVWADSELNKDFVVTSAGAASISFSLNGTLQVNADSTYDDQYFVYSSASIDDYGTFGSNPMIDWYDELDNAGTMPVSHTATFNYDFSEDDIGEEFTIDLFLDLEVSPYPFGQEIEIAEGDTIELLSAFYDGFKIDGITGGIAPADGPAPPTVPVPPSLWLLGSALVGLIGFRHKTMSFIK